MKRVVFPSGTLSISSNCLLVSMVSDEKLATNHMEDPLYMTSHFSLVVFKLLFLPLSFDSLIIMRLSEDFFEFILPGIY